MIRVVARRYLNWVIPADHKFGDFLPLRNYPRLLLHLVGSGVIGLTTGYLLGVLT